MSSYKLTYFSAKGIAEAIRMILVYSGKEFRDIRVDYNDWVSHMKKKTPFGKLPILEINGQTCHQSLALCRYLGKETDLGGTNNWENLQIDMVAETFADYRQQVASYHLEMDSNLKEKLQKLLNDTLPFFCEKIEQMLKDNGGYLANGRLSWVDLYFLGYSETLEAVLEKEVWEQYPNISQFLKNLRNIPKIKEWISKRPNSYY